MDREELWTRLLPMMEANSDYQQALQRLSDAEEDYLTLLESLTPENREILERYIATCEALDDTLVFLAYQLGKADAPIHGAT